MAAATGTKRSEKPKRLPNGTFASDQLRIPEELSVKGIFSFGFSPCLECQPFKINWGRPLCRSKSVYGLSSRDLRGRVMTAFKIVLGLVVYNYRFAFASRLHFSLNAHRPLVTLARRLARRCASVSNEIKRSRFHKKSSPSGAAFFSGQ